MEPITARHWVTAVGPKAAPAVATSTVLILARIWNANGAEHSTGAAALMGTLAAGAAAAGLASINGHHGDGTLAATAFGLSGALAVTGVAAYADSIAPGLVLWAIATVLGYVLAARYRRHDRRETTAHTQHMEIRREDHRHAETIEIIRARTQTEALAYAVALSDARAHRDGLPGFTHPTPAQLTGVALPELPAIEKGPT
ncbi:hypothetical protein [Streptomyces syringium]|uniref:hypothetical protein n=1 Tax=Streptomyces syringium TaxID=76729 RepID=UPI003443D986